MKRFIGRVSLLLAILLLCAGCAFAASYPCTGYTTKNAVNVRKKASQNSDAVGKLKLNETVTVVAEEQNGKTLWYKIEFGKGKKGYVRGDLIALQAVHAENQASAAAPAPAAVPAATAKPKTVVAPSPSEASGNDPFYLLRGLGVSAHDWYTVEDNRYTFATAIMVGTFSHPQEGVSNIFEESISRGAIFMGKKDNGIGLICFGNDAVVFASWLPDTDTGRHTVIPDLSGVPASEFDLIMRSLVVGGIFDEYEYLDSYRIIRMVEELL